MLGSVGLEVGGKVGVGGTGAGRRNNRTPPERRPQRLTAKKRERIMQQWEYLTEFIWASVDNEGWNEYKQAIWPNWKPKGRHTPLRMIPQLNSRGKEGWELVHMQPVGVDRDRDVFIAATGAVTTETWSSAYFCVWKRPKP